MRVSSFAVARPAYYDRNAVSSVQGYLNALAPHAGTTRWTTTVAAGKKLFIEVTPTRILRLTAAAVAGLAAIEISLYSGATILVMVTNYQVDNTLNNPSMKDTVASYTLYAGEYISAITADYSTGGTISFSVNQKGTLFDA